MQTTGPTETAAAEPLGDGAAVPRARPGLASILLAVPVLALGAYFIATALLYVVRHGSRLFITDHISWLQRYFEEGTLSSILAHPLGHPEVFPHLAYILDIRFFSGSQELLLALGFGLALLVFAGLAVAILRDPGMQLVERAAALTLVASTTFWMGSHEMLLWGYAGVKVFLVSSSLVFALLLFARSVRAARAGGSSARPMILACLLCLVASFSFGSGLSSLPTLFALGFLLRLPLRLQAIPAVFLALCLVLYFLVLPCAWQAVRPADAFGGGASNLAALAYNARIFPFALDWIGAFGAEIHSALAGMEALRTHDEAAWTRRLLTPSLGLVTILLAAPFAVRAWRRPESMRELDILALGLVTFGMGVSLQIALARTLDNPEAAVSHRYMVSRGLLHGGLFLLLVSAAARARPTRPWTARLLTLGLLVLPVAMVPSHLRGVKDFVNRDGTRRAMALATVLDVDDLAGLASVATFWHRVRPYVEAEGLGWFGFEEWQVLGRRVDDVYELRPGPVVRASWSLTRMLPSEEGQLTPARFEGSAIVEGHGPPALVAVLNAEGVIRGVAVPAYIMQSDRGPRGLGRFELDWFKGYIADYHPRAEYTFLAVLDGYEQAVPFEAAYRRARKAR